MNNIGTIILDKIVFIYLEILIMKIKNRIHTSPKHVTLQNFVIDFVEQQAQKNNKSFFSQLNSIVRIFKKQYDL